MEDVRSFTPPPIFCKYPSTKEERFSQWKFWEGRSDGSATSPAVPARHSGSPLDSPSSFHWEGARIDEKAHGISKVASCPKISNPTVKTEFDNAVDRKFNRPTLVGKWLVADW